MRFWKRSDPKSLEALNHDAVDTLTDFQIDEFREAFRVFDIDGSGNIDKDELRKLMASVGQMPDDNELEEMVRIADADGSGEVDFYEFVALMAHKMADPANNDAVSSAFQLFDQNHDNTIDAQELGAFMMNVGEPATWEDVNTVLREVDQSGDGIIDISEFTKMVLLDKHDEKEQDDKMTHGKRRKPKATRASQRKSATAEIDVPKQRARAPSPADARGGRPATPTQGQLAQRKQRGGRRSPALARYRPS